MFETGYAIALGKPVLIVAQEGEELPFDLKDLQTIYYHRHRLTKSLGKELTKAVRDTIEDEPQTGEGDAIQAELKEMKGMIGELLRGMKPPVSEAGANGKTGAAQSPAKVFEGSVVQPGDWVLFICPRGPGRGAHALLLRGGTPA